MKRLLHNESGQGLTEYLMLVVLIAVISITATRSLGHTIKQKIQTAREHIDQDISFSQ